MEPSSVFSLVKQFLGHVIPGVIKPLRVLWNEIIGFFFVCIGVISAVSTYRRISSYSGGVEGFMLIILAALFVLMMLGFGISSFMRARKINRT